MAAENIFTIDGVDLRVNVTKLERGFSVTDTENSGRLQNFKMHRDVAGTFYNYTIDVIPHNDHREDYDTFYEIVSSPVESHHMVFPYAQKTIKFEAYVTNGADSLQRRNGKNLWDGLSLNFVAMEPQRRP